MPQYLKEEVRKEIARAALETFAADGYAGARIPDIAARAGVSTGNIYRYFKNKDELFYAVVDEPFAATFLRVLRRRVRALQAVRDPVQPDEAAWRAADELLAFWIENRLKVVVILSRAQGSRYEDFPGRIVHELARLTTAHYCRRAGAEALDPNRVFVLERVFENTLAMIVAILLSTDDAAVIRARFTSFWRYQLAGLPALMEGGPSAPAR